MSKLEQISVKSILRWINALKSCGDHDAYHLPQYHLIADKMDEGCPYLFYYKDKYGSAALPLLLRPVHEINGLETYNLYDITSVYGYPGIVTTVKSHDTNAHEFRQNFQTEFLNTLNKLSVVSFFSRCNPLFPNTWLLNGLAEVLPLSNTIAIDLNSSEEDQLKNMSKGHRYDIRKARKAGVVVKQDSGFQYLDDFIKIYNETMLRNQASKKYFFSKQYYIELIEKLNDNLELYFACIEGKPVSASIFLINNGIIQYHLSGTPTEFLNLNGAKLILDEVRQWGKKKNFSWLHLGGGVGSSEDSLFRFKAGFSKTRLPFEVTRLVVDKEAYMELANARLKWANERGYSVTGDNFFPEYRKPLKLV